MVGETTDRLQEPRIDRDFVPSTDGGTHQVATRAKEEAVATMATGTAKDGDHEACSAEAVRRVHQETGGKSAGLRLADADADAD